MIILNTETGRVEVEGSSIQLAVEDAALIKGIHDGFVNEGKEEGAKDFKKHIETLLPATFLPSDEIVKQAEEMKKQTVEKMGDLADALKTLQNVMKATTKDELEQALHDLEAHAETIRAKKKAEEDKDIRSADFDSEDEFVKWFRGTDEEENK